MRASEIAQLLNGEDVSGGAHSDIGRRPLLLTSSVQAFGPSRII